jgi:hypothetical protein
MTWRARAISRRPNQQLHARVTRRHHHRRGAAAPRPCPSSPRGPRPHPHPHRHRPRLALATRGPPVSHVPRLGPAGDCPLRHRMISISRNEGSTGVGLRGEHHPPGPTPEAAPPPPCIKHASSPKMSPTLTSVSRSSPRWSAAPAAPRSAPPVEPRRYTWQRPRSTTNACVASSPSFQGQRYKQ